MAATRLPVVKDFEGRPIKEALVHSLTRPEHHREDMPSKRTMTPVRIAYGLGVYQPAMIIADVPIGDVR